MPAIQIFKDIYWVGAIDWNLRTFHGHTYSTKRGTTYNAYLILDEKIALVDTVYEPFSEELIKRIEEIVDPKKIDYIITNHVETDHTGALPALKEIAKKAKIICSTKCKEGILRHYYGDWLPSYETSLPAGRQGRGIRRSLSEGGWDFQVVKTGDTLKLGKKTLSFVEAPMIHWPDSMFTYLVEDQILMPNDAFGQHYATSKRFDDEVDELELMDEAAKYYANILFPLSPVILKKIQEVQKMGITIKMIAPSHGIIWRKDPAKIVNAYVDWASNKTKPKVVVVYETMWGATEKMAKKIAEGMADNGIEVKIFDVNQTDRTEIIKEMLDAKGYIIGSSTHDNDMLPNMGGFLTFFKGLKPKNRIGAAFGSYGWAGGAVKSIEEVIKESGVELTQPSISVKYVPDENELKSCYEFGRNFVESLKGDK